MERTNDSDDLRAETANFAKQMGFEHFVYALTISVPSLKQQHYVINGFPREWFKRYMARSYFTLDPVVRHAQISSLPVTWTDPAFHDCKYAEFWDEARSLGLSAGLSFTVREQPGVTGILSLARDKKIELPCVDLAALIGRAQMFASMLHQAVVRIDLPNLLPEQNVALTPREREWLKWSADGKTAWEISRILNITERTVVFHVNHVIQKLGASNKVQAIVRAIALKLV